MSSIPMLNQIRYWINAVPTTYCALFEDESDLVDGLVLLAMVCKVLCIESVPDANTQTTAIGRIRCVISVLHDTCGWESLPAPLKDASAAELISQGHKVTAWCLLNFLYHHSNADLDLNQPTSDYVEGYFLTENPGKYHLSLEPEEESPLIVKECSIRLQMNAIIQGGPASIAHSVGGKNKKGGNDLDRGTPISRDNCSRYRKVQDKPVPSESTKSVLLALKNKIAINLKASESARRNKMLFTDESNTTIVLEGGKSLNDRKACHNLNDKSVEDDEATVKKPKKVDNNRDVLDVRCCVSPQRPATDLRIYQSSPSFQRHINCSLHNSIEDTSMQIRATQSDNYRLNRLDIKVNVSSANELQIGDNKTGESSVDATKLSGAISSRRSSSPHRTAVSAPRAFDESIVYTPHDNSIGRMRSDLLDSCMRNEPEQNAMKSSGCPPACTLSGIVKDSPKSDVAKLHNDSYRTVSVPYIQPVTGGHRNNATADACHKRFLDGSNRAECQDVCVNNDDHPLAAATVQIEKDRMEEEKEEQLIVSWLSDLGVHAVQMGAPPRQPWFHRSAQSKILGSVILDCKNEWYNGVLLCELCPILCPLQREESKNVVTYNRDGHKICSRLVLTGSEVSVRSKAQVLRNLQLSLRSLQRISGMEGLLDHFSAEDIVSGRVSLWYVLHKLRSLTDGKKIRQNVKSVHTRVRTAARPPPAFHDNSPRLAAVDCSELLISQSTGGDILECNAASASAAITSTSTDSLSGYRASPEGSENTPKNVLGNSPGIASMAAIDGTSFSPPSVACSTPDTQHSIGSIDSPDPSSVGSALWSPRSQKDGRGFDQTSEMDDGKISQILSDSTDEDEVHGEVSLLSVRRLSTNERALCEHLAALQEDMGRLDQQYDQLYYQNDDLFHDPGLVHRSSGDLNHDIQRSELELEGEIQKYCERSQQKNHAVNEPNILESIKDHSEHVDREAIVRKVLPIDSPSSSCSVSEGRTASHLRPPPPPPPPPPPVKDLMVSDAVTEVSDPPCHPLALDTDMKVVIEVTNKTEVVNSRTAIMDSFPPVSTDVGRYGQEGVGEKWKQFISLLSLFPPITEVDPQYTEDLSLLLATPLKRAGDDTLKTSAEKELGVGECFKSNSAAHDPLETIDAKVLNERLSCIAECQHQAIAPTQDRRHDVRQSRREGMCDFPLVDPNSIPADAGQAAAFTSEHNVSTKQPASRCEVHKEASDRCRDEEEGGGDENKENNRMVVAQASKVDELDALHSFSGPLDVGTRFKCLSGSTTPYDRCLFKLEKPPRTVTAVDETGSDESKQEGWFGGSAASRLIEGLLPHEAEYLDRLTSPSDSNHNSDVLRDGAADHTGYAPMTLAQKMVLFKAKYSGAFCGNVSTEGNNNMPLCIIDEEQTRTAMQPSAVVMEGSIPALPRESSAYPVPPSHDPAASHTRGAVEGRPSRIKKRDTSLGQRLSQVHRVRTGDNSTCTDIRNEEPQDDECRTQKGSRTMIEGSKKLKARTSRLRAMPSGQSSPVSSSDCISRDSLEGHDDAEEWGTGRDCERKRKTVKSRSSSRTLDRGANKSKSKDRGRGRVGAMAFAPQLPALTHRLRVAAIATDCAIECDPTLEVSQSEPVTGYSSLAMKKKKISRLSNSQERATVTTPDIRSSPAKVKSRAEKRSGMDWLPDFDDVKDRTESQRSDNRVVCGVTDGQVNRIRDWLLSLGLCVLDGEGGCDAYPLSSFGSCINNSGRADGSLEPLTLCSDRLRNGELLCDLLLILEPATCSHLKLAGLVHRRPDTVSQATENFRRVQWILKLCRHSHIASTHLSHSLDVSGGDTSGLWGLLWDIMEAYPKALETQFWSPISWKVGRYPYLPYTAVEKRSLDMALTQWLLGIGVITPLTATDPSRTRSPSSLSDPSPYSLHSSFTPYSTLLAWEGTIRNGTVLCGAAEWVVQTVATANLTATASHRSILTTGYPILSSSASHPVPYQAGRLNYARAPRTLAQCVRNAKVCVSALRCLHGMSVRYLGGGDDLHGRSDGSNDPWDLVVRGSWDVVWGLLEDMRRCVDGLPPGPMFPVKGLREKPYLGPVKESCRSFNLKGEGEAPGIPESILIKDSTFQEGLAQDEGKALNSVDTRSEHAEEMGTATAVTSTQPLRKLSEVPLSPAQLRGQAVSNVVRNRGGIDSRYPDSMQESVTEPEHHDIGGCGAVRDDTVDLTATYDRKGISSRKAYNASLRDAEFDKACCEEFKMSEDDALQWFRGRDIVPLAPPPSLPLTPTHPAAFITLQNETAFIAPDLMSSQEGHPPSIATAKTSSSSTARSLNQDQDFLKSGNTLDSVMDNCHADRRDKNTETNHMSVPSRHASAVEHHQTPLPVYVASGDTLQTPIQGHTTSHCVYHHCEDVKVRSTEGLSRKHKKAAILLDWFSDIGLPLQGRDKTSFLRGGELPWDTGRFVCSVISRLECMYSGSGAEEGAEGKPTEQNTDAGLRLRRALNDVASHTTSRSLRHACQCEGVFSAIMAGDWGAVVTLLSALRVAYTPLPR